MSNGHRVDRLKIVMHNRFAWTKRWAYRIKAYAKQWRNSGRKIVWTVNSRLGFSASILHEKKNTLSGNKLGLEWPKSYIFFSTHVDLICARTWYKLNNVCRIRGQKKTKQMWFGVSFFFGFSRFRNVIYVRALCALRYVLNKWRKKNKRNNKV